MACASGYNQEEEEAENLRLLLKNFEVRMEGETSGIKKEIEAKVEIGSKAVLKGIEERVENKFQEVVQISKNENQADSDFFANEEQRELEWAEIYQKSKINGKVIDLFPEKAKMLKKHIKHINENIVYPMRDRYTKLCAQIHEDAAEFEKRINKAEPELEALDAEHLEITARIEEMKVKTEENVAKTNELKAERIQLETDLKAFHKTVNLSKLKEENRVLVQKDEKITAENLEMEKRNAGLLEEKLKLQKQIEEIAQKLNESKKRRIVAEAEYDMAESKALEVKEDLAHFESGAAKFDMKNLRNNEKLKKYLTDAEITDAQQNYINLDKMQEAVINDSHKIEKEGQEIDTELAELSGKCNHLQVNLMDLKKENERLEAELKELEEEEASESGDPNETAELEKEIAELQKENETLEKEITFDNEKMNMETVNYNKKLKKLNHKIEKMKVLAIKKKQMMAESNKMSSTKDDSAVVKPSSITVATEKPTIQESKTDVSEGACASVSAKSNLMQVDLDESFDEYANYMNFRPRMVKSVSSVEESKSSSKSRKETDGASVSGQSQSSKSGKSGRKRH